MRPAHVLVVLGQRGRGRGVRVGGVRQPVLVGLQQVSDLFEAHEAGLVGAPAGGIEALVRVAFAELQQSQAGAVGLLGVGAALELAADPGVHVRAELCGPALQARRRPLLLRPVAFGHVGRAGGEAVVVPARMGGDAALVEVQLNQGVGRVYLDPFADILVRHGVVMLLVLDVVINVHGGRFDMHVLIRLRRQGFQGGFIQCLKGGPPAAGPAFEGPVVEVIEQGGDMAVQLIQGKEPVMPQAGQDPALHQQHALFGLGFIAGFIRTRRQDGRLVVLGPLLVAGVDVRVVAAGAAHPAAQVVGDDERGDAAEVGHGAGVAAQPVGERLGPGGLGEGVIGGAQHRDKQLRRVRLAGAGIDDGHGIPAVIDKALLSGLVRLAHGALLPAQPVAVAVAELGVAVTAVRILLRIVLPDQPLGDMGTPQFLVHRGPVRRRTARAGAGIGAGVEQPGQTGVIQVIRQRPGQVQCPGAAEALLYPADTQFGAAADGAHR